MCQKGPGLNKKGFEIKEEAIIKNIHTCNNGRNVTLAVICRIIACISILEKKTKKQNDKKNKKKKF